MVNFTILNKKDLIKYLVKFMAVIITVVLLTRFFVMLKEENQNVEVKKNEILGVLEEASISTCIDTVLPKIASISASDTNVESELNTGILSSRRWI